MLDLRDGATLQIPSMRRPWKLMWGQRLAPRSFTSLCCEHLHYILCTHTHTRQDVRIRSEARKSHQTPFVIWSPKPASVRWDSWKSLSSAIRSDYSKMSLYLKPKRRPRGTVCSCCETESSRSLQVSEPGRRSPAPGVKMWTKGHFSAPTSNTWELSCSSGLILVSVCSNSLLLSSCLHPERRLAFMGPFLSKWT